MGSFYLYKYFDQYEQQLSFFFQLQIQTETKNIAVVVNCIRQYWKSHIYHFLINFVFTIGYNFDSFPMSVEYWLKRVTIIAIPIFQERMTVISITFLFQIEGWHDTYE